MKPNRKKRTATSKGADIGRKWRTRNRLLHDAVAFLRQLHRPLEICATPDDEYCEFDVGIREPNGDVDLIATFRKEEDAKALVAMSEAVVAATMNGKSHEKESYADRSQRAKSEALAVIHESIHHPDAPERDDLLPDDVADHLLMACFISGTVRAAQNAERMHGVPASLLISLAIQQEWDYRELRPSVGPYFLSLADRLKKDPRLQPALAVASNPLAFAEELHRSGVMDYDPQGCVSGVIDRMNTYRLHELNVVHVTPHEIREYLRHCDQSLDSIFEVLVAAQRWRGFVWAGVADGRARMLPGIYPPRHDARASGKPKELRRASKLARP
jgi:hypothetical protein